MPTTWLLNHGFLFVLLIVAIRVTGAIDVEEDEILQQAMSEDAKLASLQPQDFMDLDVIKRANTNYNGESAPKERKGKQAENIVGDMKKYGLWEYSTDTTGMGDQFNEMMKNSKETEGSSEMSPETLLKHADKVNAEINKYAEQPPTAGPTIDPYDTPLGYAPPTVSLATRQQEHPENNIINIPDAPMVIEDEHGNNLDNYPQSGLKGADTNQREPTRASPTQTPTVTSLPQKTAMPTTALTLKLLGALKNSKSFLQNAQQLLESPGDSDEDLYKKQKRLLEYLQVYEADKEQLKASSQKEHHPDGTTRTEEKPASTNENILVRVIQYLSTRDPATKVSDILNLLKGAVAGVGHPSGTKTADDINSIKSPPGTPDKPMKTDIGPTNKITSPVKKVESQNDAQKSHDLPIKSKNAPNSDVFQKEMMDALFSFYKPKLETRPAQESMNKGGHTGAKSTSTPHLRETGYDKNIEKEKLMIEKLKQMTAKGSGDIDKTTDIDRHSQENKNESTYTALNAHKVGDDFGSNDTKAQKVSQDGSDKLKDDSMHVDKGNSKQNELTQSIRGPKSDDESERYSDASAKKNQTKEDALGDKVYEYLKNTKEFKKVIAEHMKMFESANNLSHVENITPPNTIKEKSKNAPELKVELENVTADKEKEAGALQLENDKQDVKFEKGDHNLLKKLEEIRREKERLQKEEEELRKIQVESSTGNEISTHYPKVKMDHEVHYIEPFNDKSQSQNVVTNIDPTYHSEPTFHNYDYPKFEGIGEATHVDAKASITAQKVPQAESVTSDVLNSKPNVAHDFFVDSDDDNVNRIPSLQNSQLYAAKTVSVENPSTLLETKPESKYKNDLNEEKKIVLKGYYDNTLGKTSSEPVINEHQYIYPHGMKQNDNTNVHQEEEYVTRQGHLASYSTPNDNTKNTEIDVNGSTMTEQLSGNKMHDVYLAGFVGSPNPSKAMNSKAMNNGVHINPTIEPKEVENVNPGRIEKNTDIKAENQERTESTKLRSLGNVVLNDLQMFQKVINESSTKVKPVNANPIDKFLSRNIATQVSKSGCKMDDDHDISNFQPKTKDDCKILTMSTLKGEEKGKRRKHRLPMHNPGPNELNQEAKETSSMSPPSLSPPSAGDLEFSYKPNKVTITRKITETTPNTHNQMPDRPIMLRQGISSYHPRYVPYSYILTFLNHQNISSKVIKDAILGNHLQASDDNSIGHASKLLDVNASKRKLYYYDSIHPQQRRNALRRMLLRYIIATRHLPDKTNHKDAYPLDYKSKVKHLRYGISNNTSSGFLVPEAAPARLINVSQTKESSVIVPGTNYATATFAVDPGDVTRSKLPKVRTNNTATSIEDVFSAIGTGGDQYKSSKTDKITDINLKNLLL